MKKNYTPFVLDKQLDQVTLDGKTIVISWGKSATSKDKKVIAAAIDLLNEHITDIKILEDILNGNSKLTPLDKTGIEAILNDKRKVIRKATR